MPVGTGFSVPAFGFEQRAIVDGDATSAAIAAASIVAKVTRDRYIQRADAQHPGWGFAEHVGYSYARAPRGDPAPGVFRRHRMSFQSLAYQQLTLAGGRAGRSRGLRPGGRGACATAHPRGGRDDELVALVEQDSDCVETQLGGARWGGLLGQPGDGEAAQAAALGVAEALQRLGGGGARAQG